MVDHRQESAQLSDRAYGFLKDAILSLRLRPGQALVERSLADSLSMSATPIREALQKLAHEGLVTRVPFKGAYVSMVSLADAEEIYELREILESRCARACATQLSEKDLQEMRELFVVAENNLRSGNNGACGDAVWRLHDVLMRGTRNSRLIDFLNHIRSQARRIGAVTAYVPGRSERSIREHAALLDALERRNPDLAEQRMVEHIRTLWEDLRKDYERRGVSATFLVSEEGIRQPITNNEQW